jgi:hypothetical protein
MSGKKSEVVNWDEFKLKISAHIKAELGPRLCRGQANSNWPLVTSFHRKPNGLSVHEYMPLVHEMADLVGTIEKREIDTKSPERLGTFVAYLQHHGFPTPILDFSLSPYIAAFFAFSEILEPESEYVSIFVFDFLKWIAHWKQTYDITVTDEHVTVFKPKSVGNPRQLNQQGYYYLLTNAQNVDQHIHRHEIIKETEYLQKFDLRSTERNYVLTDLEAMGIHRYSLFGTTEAFCVHLREAIFSRTQNGKNAVHALRELMLKHTSEKT